MTPPARIGERPSASRIDDRGSPHILVSLGTWPFEAGDTVPSPAGLAPADLRSHVAMR